MTKNSLHVLALFIVIVGCMISCKKKEETPDAPAAAPTQADFAGTWNASSDCGNYPLTVTASGSSLTLKNVNSSFTLSATASGTSMSIPKQLVYSRSGEGPFSFQGSGSLKTSTQLSFTFVEKDITGTPLNCSASATK